jgi:Tfp pilus assembly protein PilX
MLIQLTTAQKGQDRSSERGAALIMALMVSLVLVFLGMGLLLQTSLGLQAAGTDRWVTKALYAADAGAMMQIEMIQLGALGAAPGASGMEIGTFILEDDPGLPGMLKGQFSVTISNFCESQPATPVIANGIVSSFPEFQTRHFHLRSEASRDIGGLMGLTRAAVEADVSSFPFTEEQFVPVRLCY